MTMASITRPTPFGHRHLNPTSLFSAPVILSFPVYKMTPLHHLRVYAALHSDGDKIGSQQPYGTNLLRKSPIPPARRDLGGNSEKEEGNEGESEDQEEGWIDWEDKILQDTVPLVGFVRMILHSGKYESGARLNPQHERTILERLLPYHPEFEKKIGCGIDYITVNSYVLQGNLRTYIRVGDARALLGLHPAVSDNMLLHLASSSDRKIGYHPDFERSRCLFIVRKDGELVDFSFWKCIKGLIRKNYPLYADSFILRHFRRHRQSRQGY